jgi:acetyltransferase
MQELPATMLSRFTLIDYDREMALVAIHTETGLDEQGQPTETSRIVGVSRYITNPDRSTCEFSLVVADDFKGQGLGSRLMLSIMDFAREKGLTEIEGLVLANNHNMLKLMKSLGFAIKSFAEDPDFKLVTHQLQAT